MRKIVLIIHNVRSAHNVGSLLRTADGLGVERVYLTGYSPYPMQPSDNRLPHMAAKIHRQISKTALGAEDALDWFYEENIEAVFEELIKASYQLAALEQSDKSIAINDYDPPEKIALVVGNEVDGIDHTILESIKTHLEIPMYGQKESFNVANAAAMAMFYLRFPPK